jgi:hypothetical protein
LQKLLIDVANLRRSVTSGARVGDFLQNSRLIGHGLREA